MPEVEFVNRELAESEAARAIGLLNQSDETKVEAWLALRAVADQVGVASNTGVKGITWQSKRPGERLGTYYLNARCNEGVVKSTFAGPLTLDEARSPEYLGKIVANLEGEIAALGGLSQPLRRPTGTSAALVAAVSATPEGRDWLGRQKTRYGASSALLRMVAVADSYGREGINPAASEHAHEVFFQFANRAELIREFPSVQSARAKAMSLRSGQDLPREVPKEKGVIPDSRVTRLAVTAGVSRAEARTILRALLDGRSKTKLIRAINEAVRMVDEMEARKSSTVAA